MTVLSDRAATRTGHSGGDGASATPGRGRSGVVVGLLAGLQALFTGLLVVVVIALATWVATPRLSVPWAEAATVAVHVWLVGHGVPLALAAGQISIVPLGLTLPLLWLCWAGGCRITHAAHDSDRPRRFVAIAGSTFVAIYAVVAGGLANIAASDDVRAPLGSALLSTALVAALGTTVASFPLWRGHSPRRKSAGATARAAGTALLGWGALALLALLAGVLLGFSRILDVQQALHPGASGHVLLVLLQLLAVPTALTWSGAYVTGSGFAVGAGTWVSPGSTELGPLPAFPLLGALPSPGAHPVASVLLPLGVLVVGAVVGRRWRASHPGQTTGRLVLGAAGVAVAAGATAALLAGLSSGAVGAGRMAQIGPDWFGVFVRGGLELFVGAVIAIVAGPFLAGGRASRAANQVGRLARDAGHRARAGISERAGIIERVGRSRRPRR